MDLKNLKAKANQLSPIVRIGKNGITETIVGEVKKNLKVHKIIKIKLLRAFVEENDRKTAAKELSEKTDSQIVQNTGFTIVLYRR